MTQRTFSLSGNNKGLWCPFKPALCQEGYCRECRVYLDWQKLRRKQAPDDISERGDSEAGGETRDD